MPVIVELAVLAIVVIAMLLIVQVITLEQAMGAIGRVILLIFAATLALCYVRDLWRRVFMPGLGTLEHELGVVLLGLVLVLLVGLGLYATRRKSTHNRHEKGD